MIMKQLAYKRKNSNEVMRTTNNGDTELLGLEK